MCSSVFGDRSSIALDKIVRPSESLQFTSISGYASSFLTQPKCPFARATDKGVRFQLLRTFTFAPASFNSSIHSGKP